MATQEKEAVRDQVVELLNKVSFAVSEKERVSLLCQVQELVVKRDPTLLDAFFEEVVAFQNDKNADVRKFVVAFIEDVCKSDSAMLPRLIPNLALLCKDLAPAVLKRAIPAAAVLLRLTLSLLAAVKTAMPANLEQSWTLISSIKSRIVEMVEHDNDGVRTQSIKFMESVILAQTYTEALTETPKVAAAEFSLDCLRPTAAVKAILKPRKLEEEAKTFLRKMTAFAGSLHISAVNLMTCLSALGTVARGRPTLFMAPVIDTFQILHANLPPTLTKSQTSSARKALKTQLLQVLRHPSASHAHADLANILVDLNTSQQEISKAATTREDLRRRTKRPSAGPRPEIKKKKKQPRLSVDTPEVPETPQDPEEGSGSSALGVTQQWVAQKLGVGAAADIVMASMNRLPDHLPAVFLASYVPVNAAGSSWQRAQVSRLLAAQIAAAREGPAKETEVEAKKLSSAVVDEDDSDEEAPPISIPTLEASNITEKRIYPLMPAALIARPVPQRAKFVRLAEVTPPTPPAASRRLQCALWRAMIKAEPRRLHGGAAEHRRRILIKLAAGHANEPELEAFETAILSDPHEHSELLHGWMFSLFAQTRKLGPLDGDKASMGEFATYEKFLSRLVNRMAGLAISADRDEALSRLVLECPCLTSDAIMQLLRAADQANTTAEFICGLLARVAKSRPASAKPSIKGLCELATHSLLHVRDAACNEIARLHGENEENDDPKANLRFRDKIHFEAKSALSMLAQRSPPDTLFQLHLGRGPPPPPSLADEKTDGGWEEEVVRACLALPMRIVPLYHDLLHDLALVYVETGTVSKRLVLRLVESGVSAVGVSSPSLISLVRSCPKGAETLLTRVLHILTEKTAPSASLVSAVKSLYGSRVSDVRFLIPVLGGLSRQEVVDALPQLVKLNPHVVREVLHRLCVANPAPLSPAELLTEVLLVADAAKDKMDVKNVIKASSLCLAERSVFTGEVVASALQQLLSLPSLPTLFLRTAIQAMTHHPRLRPFIVNLMRALVEKKVWEDRSAWEGFVKCVERSLPQSAVVLLQLPAPQLERAFEAAPILRDALKMHVTALAEQQRSHILPAILDVIDKVPETVVEGDMMIEPTRA